MGQYIFIKRQKGGAFAALRGYERAAFLACCLLGIGQLVQQLGQLHGDGFGGEL